MIKLYIYISLLIVLTGSGCSVKQEHKKGIKVEVDTKFGSQLWPNKEYSFSGGDGCISIDMGNGQSLFLWGDSFIGEVKNNQRDSTSALIAGNIFTVLDKQGIRTIFGGDSSAPTSVILSDSIDGHKAVLWPQHGFVSNNILHLMLSTIVTTGSGTWDFYWHSTVYVRLSLPDFKLIDKQVIPAESFAQIHFGYSFIQDETYTYFYGSKVDSTNSKSMLYTARSKLINDKLSCFEYFDGKVWQTDAQKAAPARGMNINLSEQFSIFKQGEHYFLITQERGYKTNNIYSMVADKPTGPWKYKKLIYTTPEPLQNNTLWSYNAMAHPQYIKDDKVLLSYCVNTDIFMDLYKDASIYRPRFIWVKLSDLLQVDAEQVDMDYSFCNDLMPNLGGGVTGADGAISIDLKNGKSLFLWGDAFFGDVSPNGKRANPSPLVMGNVFTVIDNTSHHIETFYSGSKEKPSSYILANPIDTFPTWYWPGDGFVRDGILHLFFSKFYRISSDMWGFKYSSCDYVRLDVQTMNEIGRDSFPAAAQTGIHFGHAILDDNKYIYVYGTKYIDADAPAKVYVARGTLSNSKLDNWEYYSNSSWTKDPFIATPLPGINISISEQFNVLKIQNKYVLISQDRGENVKNIYSFTSDTPVGLFTEGSLIFTVDEPDYEKKQMMTYNAMVHPQYEKEGKILMCYNVNTNDFFSHYTDATLYQPRFFWMPISKILNK